MENIILKHALLNAIQYNGKANENAVLGKVLSEVPEARKNVELVRKSITKIVAKVNKMKPEEQQKLIKGFKVEKVEKKEREGLPPLTDAVDKKVVMRLAPFPSGPLHIGNAKQFIINDWYVKHYGGKLILFIDDTMGSMEKQIVKDAYDLIPEGLTWLGIKYDKKIYYKSDRLDIYYKYAEELIKKDKAYVCECGLNELRELRAQKKECIHRQRSVDENLKFWNDMLKGKYKEGEVTLRIKTDMNHPNPAFRDRVLFRVSDRVHPRVKNKYKVWPLLEFSWAVDDHLCGITHILRGKDLMMESEMERYIWDIFGWKHPVIIHTGKFMIDGVNLSKSKAQHEVASGEYSGWDDPRTWSLQSLKRRGFKPEAIRNFIISFGVTEHEANVSVDKLYSENRKLIDSKSERYFFVSDPVEITLNKIPARSAKAPLFPGKRKFRKIPVTKKIYVDKIDFVANREKEVRLMHLCNIDLDKKAKFTGKTMKDIPKIHWVSSKHVKIKIVLDNGKTIEGLAEPAVAKVKPNQMVQFERLFFVRADKKNLFYYAHK
ncbi:MAG: glutamate--tRNA ligase [Candidatus Aenigmarchaeota archaeon]|nr:glutamate--tRNA ligase [Candidatus Aenigmarchaeota archaeon]